MDYLFTAVDLGFFNAAEAHADNAREHAIVWSGFKTNRTCLYCLRRPPEFVLSCEHAICEECFLAFGSKVVGKECHYQMQRCILCVSKGTAIVKIKPPTADARVLSIDGGGVGGVVPLEHLRLLQRAIGSELSVRDLFELGFGTSSGDVVPFDQFCSALMSSTVQVV